MRHPQRRVEQLELPRLRLRSNGVMELGISWADNYNPGTEYKATAPHNHSLACFSLLKCSATT